VCGVNDRGAVARSLGAQLKATGGDDFQCQTSDAFELVVMTQGAGQAPSDTPDEPNSGGNCPETLSNQGPRRSSGAYPGGVLPGEQRWG
jgi:hypothetical protein